MLLLKTQPVTHDAVCKIRIKRVEIATKIIPVRPCLMFYCKNNCPALKFRKRADLFVFPRIGDHLNPCLEPVLPAMVCEMYLEIKSIWKNRYFGHRSLLSSWMKGFFFIQNLSDLFHCSLQAEAVIIVAGDTSFSLRAEYYYSRDCCWEHPKTKMPKKWSSWDICWRNTKHNG